MMKRLMELDEQRRRLRAWMDSEEAGEPLDLFALRTDAGVDEMDPNAGP
jgi:hypothetical protein